MKSLKESMREALFEAQSISEAAKYLAHAKAHEKAAAEAKNFHTLFRGEAGTLEKQLSKKNRELSAAHTAAAAALLKIHSIHKGPDAK
jgi:hypothetical protein